jgi:hypothetical protein
MGIKQRQSAMRGWIVVTAAGLTIAVALAATAVAQAVTFRESGDAGNLPTTAQVASGAVDGIEGILEPTTTDVDLYQVCLAGGRSFSATTGPPPPGFTGLDTKLYLFDASGRGVYANDDFVGLTSTLPAGHPLTPSEAGIYYLGISFFGTFPFSGGGHIFGEASDASGVYAPEGPGGELPLSHWRSNFIPAGRDTYRIALTGTRACVPTSKDQCRNGGWRNFPGFKNPGECVAFVQRGPKP